MTRLPIALITCLALTGCSPKKKSDREPEDDAAHKGTDTALGAQEIQPELMVLRQVLVEESGDQGELALEAGQIAKHLGGRLVTSGFLAGRVGDVPDSHLARRVEVFVTLSHDWAPRAEKGSGALVLAAEARVEFVDARADLAPRVAVLMEATVPRPADGGAAQTSIAQEALLALASAATNALADGLVARERLRRASHAELLSALSVGLREPDMRIWALQLAADRGLKESIPAATEALSAENEDLQAVALSVLVALGDQSSVPAIIKQVDFNSHEDLRVAMEAISAIGGSEAIEFLEFVASGHSDTELRQRAKERLDEMRNDSPSGI